jgi:hypothetical protein
MCNVCGRGTLSSYSDPEDSWLEHANPLGAIIRLGVALFNNTPATDVLRCSNCNRYGFTCPHCSHTGITEVLPGHGQKRVCTSCSREFITRNPSNFFSLK